MQFGNEVSMVKYWRHTSAKRKLSRSIKKLHSLPSLTSRCQSDIRRLRFNEAGQTVFE